MVEVTFRTQSPYSAICYISVTFADGYTARGSGAVIGVNDVLTAMHVVYQPSHGGWARSISVMPAADTVPYLVTPYGSYSDWGKLDSRATNWDSDGDGLLTSAEAQWDLAVIGLRSRIGDVTGWLGTWATAQDVQGTLLGYPARGTGLMALNAFADASERFGVYDVSGDLGPGASGGPLLLTSNGQSYVAGVLSSGNSALTESTYAALFGNGTWDWLQSVTGANDSLLGAAPAQATLVGTAGIDTARYSGNRSSYVVSVASGTITVRDTVAGRDGTDTLTAFERVRFADVSLAFDLGGHAGTAAKVIGAVFGRASVANRQYEGIALALLDAGASEADLVQLALGVKLGAAASNAAVVDLLYTNVVGVAPSSAQRAAFETLLDSGFFTRAALGVLAAESPLNAAAINLVGLASGGLEYLPA